MSQSPQIGSMFLTDKLGEDLKIKLCRNPLKSGQCFLQIYLSSWKFFKCFYVAIPSNRVNVSYLEGLKESGFPVKSQSPQIGSMFLTTKKEFFAIIIQIYVAIPSNRVNVSYLIKIGKEEGRKCKSVAIPSNRVNVSYKAK